MVSVPVLNLSSYRYDITFVGMVLPGDELTVKLHHIGMQDGNIVINIKTSNSWGKKVIQGSAKVSQSSTIYVFTGQGSQEPSMGMDLYNSLPAACAVWEGADTPPCCLWVLDRQDHKGQPKGENDPLQWYQRSGHSTMLHGHDL